MKNCAIGNLSLIQISTLLRDLIRQLSDGVPRLQFAGVNVSVVDERSELAGCVQGIPQLAVGCRTDVLDEMCIRDRFMP